MVESVATVPDEALMPKTDPQVQVQADPVAVVLKHRYSGRQVESGTRSEQSKRRREVLVTTSTLRPRPRKLPV